MPLFPPSLAWCWRWRGDHDPSAKAPGSTAVPALRRGVFRVERARASVASKNSRCQQPAASSLTRRFPSAAAGVCWQRVGAEPGAGERWPAASPAASASCWKGASARSHAQLEVPQGFRWSCVTPCTLLQFLARHLRPCEVLPCASEGSQAGVAFLSRHAEYYCNAKGKVFHSKPGALGKWSGLRSHWASACATLRAARHWGL